MIRYIVETITSERDVNGNCYCFAVVTSTKTKARILFNTGGKSNAIHDVMRLLDLTWKDVYEVQVTLPKRRWREYAKAVTLYEHELTPEMLLAIEQEG